MGPREAVCPSCGYDATASGPGPRPAAGTPPTRWVRTAVPVLLVLFFAPLFFMGVARPDWEIGWMWTLRLIGAAIAVTGAVELIRLAARGGEPGPAAVPWIVVVLTGALILSQGGAAAFGLGGIGIALIVREVWPRPGRPPLAESGSGKARMPEV
jgi:hypothetical protein